MSWSWEEYEELERATARHMIKDGYSRPFNLRILKDVEFSDEHSFKEEDLLWCYTKVDDGDRKTAHLLVTCRIRQGTVQQYRPSLRFKETLSKDWKDCVRIV